VPVIRLEKVLALAEEAAEVASRLADRTDRAARWPEEPLRTLQASGLAGLVISEDKGGWGHGMYALLRVCETLGRACASTSLCFGMHGVASAVLASKATDLQRERFLQPIVDGVHLTTLALSEPSSGSSFWIPTTTLVARSDSIVLDGFKSFVTNGGRADSYVLNVVSPDTEDEPGEFSCVAVPGTSAGLVWGPSWDGLGMRGNSSCSVELASVEVPRDHVLGQPGDHVWYVFGIVAPYFIAAMTGTYLGIADAAFKITTAMLGARRFSYSSRVLADEDVIQADVGELWAVIERTRHLSYQAASAADAGEDQALPSLFSAKAEVARAVETVVDRCMTLAGGSAYATSSPLWRHLRDARAAHVMSPTTHLLRLWTGRSVLGKPLLRS